MGQTKPILINFNHMSNRVADRIQSSINVKQQLLNDETFRQNMEAFVDLTAKVLQQGGKILFCGNGGSAADAQHIAAELSGRFYKDREPYFAEALTVNTSYLTAVANDYGYDEIFSRLVKSKGRKGDILVGISTSGNSPNVVKAMETAREIGMHNIGWTGQGGGKMSELSELLFAMPSPDTPRIQEAHIMIGHILCEFVEEKLG